MGRRVTENSLERTAKILTSRHNIKVLFKPGVAETKGNVIILPTLPDNADQETIDAMQGYLDQQAGYVLFSEDRIISKLKTEAQKDKEAAQLWDCFRMVEDTRVEEAMEVIYPGCEMNFTNAHHWLYSRIRENWDKVEPGGTQAMTKFGKILAASFMELRHRNTDFYENFIAQDIRDKADKAVEIVLKDRPEDTKDSLELAKEILRLLEEEKQEDQDNRPEPGEGDSDGEATENQPMTMQGAKSNAKSDGDSKGESKATGQGEMAKALAQAAQQETSENADPNHQAGRHSYKHGLDDNIGYTIFDTSEDTIESLSERTIQTHGDYLQELREESRQFTSTMRHKLINTLRASAKRRWVGGKPEGRLDPRQVHKAILGVSTDVFRTRQKKVELDTAVGLAIDHSGSMSGRSLELAAESAIVLGDVFQPLDIPFMVYGYSTRGYPRTHPLGGTEHMYSRWSNLWIRYYKTFDEPWKNGALKLTHARDNCQANTLDGESVLHGIRCLLARPEKRKILLVMNDGQPWPGYGNVGRCQGYLKSVVEAGTRAGVEIIAFGIRSQNVKEYYPNHVVINDIEDLVKEPLKKIDGMLRKGMLKAMRGK
jgi:cobaltochelatase CobT